MKLTITTGPYKYNFEMIYNRVMVVDAYLPVYQAISLKGFDTQQHLLAHAILELTSSKIDLRNPSLEVRTLIFEGALAWF